MNPERKIDPEKISIIKIKTLKGQIEGESEIDSPPISAYSFTHEFAMALNIKESLMGIKLTVGIATFDKDDKPLEIKGSYTHEFICQVDNLGDFIEIVDEGETPIDPVLVATVAGIAYSTLRGIIVTRTQGTPLDAVILPVIDPKRLIGFELKEKEKI